MVSIMSTLLKYRTLILLSFVVILSASNFMTFKLYSECKERVKVVEKMYENEIDRLNAKLEECNVRYKQAEKQFKKELEKKDKMCKEYMEQIDKLEKKINEILNL